MQSRSIGHSAAGPGFTRVLVAAAALVLAAAVPAARAQELDAAVRDALEAAKLGKSIVGVSIVDVSTGWSLAALDENSRFIPASNLKLITSGAALLALGPDFAFETRLVADGDRLIVVGSGDPALADPDLLAEMRVTVEEFLDRLAAEPARVHAEHPFGEIIVDDRVFDRQLQHPSWEADDLQKWYATEVAGLNFHANVCRATISPSTRAGESPRVRGSPEGPWASTVNKARTGASGTASSVWLQREGASNTFTAYGAIPAGRDAVVDIGLHEPGLVFGSLLASRLGEVGPTPRVRLAEPAEAAPSADAAVVAVVRTPMEVILRRCNTDSHNLYAECLFKLMGQRGTGQPGSWMTGRAAMQARIRDTLGPAAVTSVVLDDGSGLSRSNRITPGTMTQWLCMMAKDATCSEAFLTSLAEPGDGTLRTRFRGRRPANTVLAKSGYVSGVRTLSGYVRHPRTGRLVAFSILVNETPTSIPGTRVKDFHEAVVLLIDRWLSQREGDAAEGHGG